MNIKIKTGQRIKELRTQQNLSQEELAHRAALDRTYINGIENGRRNVSIINIERIASALDITIQGFFNSSIFESHDE